MSMTAANQRHVSRGRDAFELRPVAASTWAARIAIFAAALLISAGLLHRFAGLMTPAALNMFLLAFALAALSSVLALIAFVIVWRTARDGLTGGLVALAISGAILAWPAAYAPTALGTEPLNDITTDIDAPPDFLTAKEKRPMGARSVEYPGADAAALQGQRYPDIQPLVIDRAPAEAFELAGQALRKLQMEIVAEQPPEQGRPGQLEAVDRTLILGFRDDVAIRVVRLRRGARIDIRSASRWGEHDFGRNAARVRQILNELVERLRLTVPNARQAR